jgi:hypothetical protein
MRIVCLTIFTCISGLVLVAQPTPVINQVPQFGVLQTTTPMLPLVNEMDELTRKAQQEAVKVKPLDHKTFIDRAAFYLVREAQLDVVVDYAWRVMPLAQQRDLIASEPLALAVLQLQINLRRMLGPSFTTDVPGLHDTGCAGDFVDQELLGWYGRAVTEPTLLIPGDRTRDALYAIAVQVACLSDAQTAHLETAMDASFSLVSGNMKTHGYGSLIPLLARIVAPVEVLILDARKYRGEKSVAWAWFKQYSADLQTNTARAGWPSGVLYLWDRRSGKLDAFRPCQGTTLAPSCVDLQVFLKSLTDPRALGFGNCALAAMVSRGPIGIGGTTVGSAPQLYMCPIHQCTGPQTGLGGLGPQPTSPSGVISAPGAAYPLQVSTANIRQQWPNVTDADIADMSLGCKEAGQAVQGLSAEPAECSVQAGNQNPFDTYDQCMVQASGETTTPGPGEGFLGVPTSKACSASEDAGTTTSSTVAEAKPAEKASNPWTDWLTAAFTTVAELAKAATEVAKTAVSDLPKAIGDVLTKSASPATTVLDPATQLLSEHGPPAELGAAKGLIDSKLTDMYGKGEISLEERINQREVLGTPGGVDKVKQFIAGRKTGANDCVDGGACSNNCTALGKQIKSENDCQKGLVGAFTRALGLPSRSVPPTRPGPYINPAGPDAMVADTTTANDFCILGGPTTPTNPACGLILCTNSLNSRAFASGCSCEHGSENYKVNAQACMNKKRCGPDQILTEDCNCTPLGPPQGPLGPPPPPPQ